MDSTDKMTATVRVDTVSSILEESSWYILERDLTDEMEDFANELFLDLELNPKNGQPYSVDEQRQIVKSFAQPNIFGTDKAIEWLTLFIKHKLTEPALLAELADTFVDKFLVRDNYLEQVTLALTTLISELPQVDIIHFDKDSLPSRLGISLIESLVPRLIASIGKDNIEASLELITILIRRFNFLVRNYTRYGEIRFWGDYFCTGIELGRGSFANVFLGRHCKTAELVAIKKMDWDALTRGNPHTQKQLENEINIMKETNHPNIVRLYDVVREGPILNLILEFCAGGSMEEYLAKNSPLPEEEVLHWIKEFGAGLKTLRDMNIIHRDLKPGNLLLTVDHSSGHLKITDFTFARFAGHGDLCTTLVGTPLYMAPEIFKDNKYTAKGDLWSVGVIIYQMVTGKLPYKSNDYNQLVRMLHNVNWVWPEDCKVSEDIRDLVKKLLEKNPDFRMSWAEFFLHKCVRVDEQQQEPGQSIDDSFEKEKLCKQVDEMHRDIGILREELRREKERTAQAEASTNLLQTRLADMIRFISNTSVDNEVIKREKEAVESKKDAAEAKCIILQDLLDKEHARVEELELLEKFQKQKIIATEEKCKELQELLNQARAQAKELGETAREDAHSEARCKELEAELEVQRKIIFDLRKEIEVLHFVLDVEAPERNIQWDPKPQAKE